jgi:glycosyltransferase A (GT-A) superfamily protein (DUF2064 family)
MRTPPAPFSNALSTNAREIRPEHIVLMILEDGGYWIFAIPA